MVGKYGRSESRYHIHVDRKAGAGAGSNNPVMITFILICHLVVGGVCLPYASDYVFFRFNVLDATS